MKNYSAAPAKSRKFAAYFVAMSGLILVLNAHAHGDPNDSSTVSAQDWVTWGEVVHGGFGSHIALGIRIGEDAMKRLNAKRRDVEVTVIEGAKAPCACIADGLTIATAASAGQRSLTVMPKSTDDSFMVTVEVRKKKSDRSVTYVIPSSAQAPLGNMNIGKSPTERLALVMNAPQSMLFNVVEKK